MNLSIPQDLTFDFPLAVWFIPLSLIFAALFWLYFLYRKKAQHLFKMLVPRSTFIYFLKAFLFCLILVLAAVALMQPKGNGSYPDPLSNVQAPDKLKAHDVIFLIDASASMAVTDGSNGKRRLDVAKEIADEILSDLDGQAAALYAFTSTATKMSPATLDLFFVRLMLRELAINEGAIPGTDFLKSLETLREKQFKQTTEKLTTLIILSDGGDTALEGNTNNARMNAIVDVFHDAKNLNLRIFTIGIGSLTEGIIPGVEYLGKPVYSNLSSDLLKLLSEKGRGKYYEAGQQTTLDISKDIIKQLSADDPFLKEDTSENPRNLIVYQLFYQIPLGIALLLLGFYLFFPNVLPISKNKTFMIILLFFQMQLIANPEQDLKIANNFFEAGDFAKAEEYTAALLKQNLNPFEKAVVLYNQGTILLHEDNLNKAIEAFESIDLAGSPPPFLAYRIKLNLSMALYRKALMLLPDTANLEKAIYALRAAKKQVKLAEKAACHLSEIEGRASCVIPKELTELSNAIETKLENASKNLKQPLADESSEESFKRKIAEIYEKAMNLKPQNPKDLKSLLELAVSTEHETLQFTRFLAEEEQPKKAALDLIQDAQNKTLAIADAYLKASFLLQLQGYESGTCQKKPWNEILPLYHKGYSAAVEALQFMPEKLEKSALSQEEAIKYWQDASKQKEQEQNKPGQIPEKAPSQKALQLLQEMQANDQKKQKINIQPLKQDVEKPW